MKILVTGAAGFIGYHLVKELIILNHKVVGIDSINDYYDINLKWSRLKNLNITKNDLISKDFCLLDDINFYKCEIENRKRIFEIFEKERPDAVCNLAAQAGVRYSIENPFSYINSNIIGFQNIIEACREYDIVNFSYASSSSVYGGNFNFPFSTKDRTDSPISLYAATKKSNELIAYSYSHLYDISCTGLRFFTVYGPWGRPDMALFIFADAIRKNKKVNVFNHGKMIRDFTYIDDIVKGIIKVILNPAKTPKLKTELNPVCAPYKIYNIGNNDPVKLLDFIKEIENAFGQKLKVEYKELQPGDVPKTFANVEELVKDFNYKPETSIKEGVGNFVKWYKEYYKM